MGGKAEPGLSQLDIVKDEAGLMLKIGLTGGIGSGKSTVTRLFADLGVPIIDMDIIAREVVMPGQPALDEIKALFGSEICTPDNELDRKKLRDIVFSDAVKRKQLEDIVHPRIRDRVKDLQAELDAPYCIIVIPLLLETEGQDRIDRILVVDTSIEEQIQRTMQRDKVSEDQVRKIIASQVDRQTRLDKADDIINNSGATAQLQAQVSKLHQQYLVLARIKPPNS